MDADPILTSIKSEFHELSARFEKIKLQSHEEQKYFPSSLQNRLNDLGIVLSEAQNNLSLLERQKPGYHLDRNHLIQKLNREARVIFNWMNDLEKNLIK